MALISASPPNKRSSLTLLSYQGCIIIHSVKLLLYAKPRNIIMSSCAAGRIVLVLGYRSYAAMAWLGHLRHCADLRLYICTLSAMGSEGDIRWPGGERCSLADLSSSNGLWKCCCCFFVFFLFYFCQNCSIYLQQWYSWTALVNAAFRWNHFSVFLHLSGVLKQTLNLWSHLWFLFRHPKQNEEVKTQTAKCPPEVILHWPLTLEWPGSAWNLEKVRKYNAHIYRIYSLSQRTKIERADRVLVRNITTLLPKTNYQSHLVGTLASYDGYFSR